MLIERKNKKEKKNWKIVDLESGEEEKEPNGS